MNWRHDPVSALRSDVPGIEWPPVAVNMAGTLGSLMGHIEGTQWLSAEEIEDRQLHQLRVLARHAVQHSPLFHRRMSDASLSAQDLTSLEDVRRLPALRRRDVQTAGNDLFCAEVPKAHLPISVNRTSGSTGEPVAIRRTPVTELFWLATTMRGHLWNDDDVSQRFSAIRPTILTYEEHAQWGPPCSLLFTTGPAQAMPITVSTLQHVQWLTDFKPHILLSFPSIVDALCRHCRQHGVSFDRLGKIWTVGETLTPQLREHAEATLSVRITDIYSSNEVGTIAIRCPDGEGYHVMAESLIVEIVDETGRPCADGEVGRVLVTDLHNFATPLVRYEIGDYAEAAGPCGCGRGLPTLRRIVGRERNLMLMPDGTRRYPLVGFHRFRDVAPILQYQLVQHDPADVEVRLVAESSLTKGQESDLGAVILKALRAPVELRFTYFPHEIPRSPNGKFEEFICRIPPPEP